MNKKQKNFIENINLIRGWAIFLVVLGHISFMDNVAVYQGLRGLIVRFHMPLFMIISGYLFSRFSRDKLKSIPNYITFVKKKTKRLVPAYIFTTLLLLLIKSCASHFFDLMTPVNLYTFKMMFIYPMEGFVVYLWFIYTLFIIYLIYPAFEVLFSKFNIYIRILFYFLLVLIPMPKFLCLNLVFKYLIFFHLGGLVFSSSFQKPRNINLLFITALLLFFAGHTAINYLTSAGFWLELTFLMTALSGVIASYLFILKVKEKNNVLCRLFNFIGLYAFEIYLFHSLGTESIAYFLKSLLPVGPLFFSIHVPASILFGLCIPIIFIKLLTRVMPFTNKVIFGRV